MESTVYGHPGEPRHPKTKALPLETFRSGNVGLNFENQGLSAKIHLERIQNDTAAESKKVATKAP